MNHEPRNPSGSRMSDDAFVALCLMYHAGEIDEAGFAALCAELDSDADRRAMFVRSAVQVEAVIEVFEQDDAEQTAVELGIAEDDDDGLDIMNEVVDAALAERRKHELAEEANRQLAAQQQEEARQNRYKLRAAKQQARPAKPEFTLPLPLLVGGLAAMLFLTVYLLLPGDAPTTNNPPTAVNPPAGQGRTARATPDRPAAPVARLRQAHQPRWADAPGSPGSPDTAGSARPDADGRMAPGRYALASGAVELRLDRGAVLLVEGPAEFELTDNHAGRLLAGQLSIDTTDAAPGFRLQTPTAEVRDLSTQGTAGRFGVAVDRSGATSALVYAGRMDLANLAPAGGTGQHVTLSASQGAVVARADAQPQRAPVAAEQFALEMAALSGKPVVTGDADYHNHMPASAVMNRGPQSPRAWVALESTGRPLMRGTAWAQAYPARPSMLIDTHGRVVDSYLVMFDPADETRAFKTAEFTLTFPGEVLTVITENEDLVASHGWYGDADTQYAYQGRQVDGLEGEPGAVGPDTFVPDTIELSDDGRTMRVFLGAHEGADVFRVLVVRPARVGERPAARVPDSTVFSSVFLSRGSVCPVRTCSGSTVGVGPVRGGSAAPSSLKGEI